jgi:hypothetical protein
MKSFTDKPTPRESFDAIRAEYESILARLRKQMGLRAAQFTLGVQRFDSLGEEEQVLRYLAIALAAAGDRSAVDELEIEY